MTTALSRASSGSLKRLMRWGLASMAPHVIPALLRRDVGVRTLALKRLKVEGPAIVFEAATEGGPLIFKAAVRGFGAVATEAWIYSRLADLGVPVPRVLALDLSRRRFPSPYLVVDRMAGVPLSEARLSGDALRRALTQTAAHLRQVHSVPVEGFGDLAETTYLREGRLRGTYATWRDALTADVPTRLRYLDRRGVLTGAQVRHLRETLRCADAFLTSFADPRLLHGDFFPRHVLVDPLTGNVTAMIDFNGRWAGDPGRDLALFALGVEDGVLAELLRAYAPGPRDADRWTVVFPLYVLLNGLARARWWRGERQEAARAWRDAVEASTRMLSAGVPGLRS